MGVLSAETICLSVLLLLALFECGSLGSETFRSFPLMKYNKGGLDASTRKNSLNFGAASYHSAYDENASRSKAILLPYKELIRRTELFNNGTYPELSNSVIGEYQRTIAGGSSALIIVLPSDQISPEIIPQWREAERALLTNNLLIPVYFIYENEELHEILSSIETISGYEAVSLPEKIFNTLLGDNYQLTVSTSEQSILKQFTGTNIQGWLAGNNGDSSSPTIALVASYDSLAAAAELAPSAKTTTSGSVILLELARVFSKLYSQPRMQSKYNILFVLTTGGHFNYYGSKQWLSEADDRLIKSLEFVICLDSLGEDSENFYLHTSRPAKDPTANKLYKSFEDAAKSLQLNLQVSQKKVNISNNEEPWEHEHFSKRRILASTISSREDSLSNFARSHIFDTSDESIEATLQRNTQLVAEALARYMFDPPENLLVFQNSLEVGGKLQYSRFKALENMPRVFPYISDNIIDGIDSILREYSTDVTKQQFTMNKNSEYVFYSQNLPAELNISVAKPFIFDVVLALTIGCFLGGLFFLCKQNSPFNIFQ